MARLAAAVIAMEVAALVVAYLAFGWPVFVVGAPALVGTMIMFVVVRASEAHRRKREDARSLRWDATATVPGGLMSGFFEIPAQARATPVPRPTSRSGSR